VYDFKEGGIVQPSQLKLCDYVAAPRRVEAADDILTERASDKIAALKGTWRREPGRIL